MATLSANDLRQLAEAADGTRDTNLFFVMENGELVQTVNRPDSGSYVHVFTPWQGDGGLHGGEPISIAHGQISPTADAVFTTQSAFEKFALPYYIRTNSIQAVGEMLASLYQPDVIAVEHEPGSVIQGVGRDPGFYQVTAGGSSKLI